MRSTPERLAWAARLIDLAPTDAVLEIGQGTGISSGLLLERIPHGRYVGLDRSAQATAAAASRHSGAVSAGRARFMTGEIARTELPAGSFDAILAVNVNLFWTTNPSVTLRRMRGWLRPGGRLGLFWEPPGDARADEIVQRVPPVLEAAGFTVTIHRAGTSRGAPLVGVLGRID